MRARLEHHAEKTELESWQSRKESQRLDVAKNNWKPGTQSYTSNSARARADLFVPSKDLLLLASLLSMKPHRKRAPMFSTRQHDDFFASTSAKGGILRSKIMPPQALATWAASSWHTQQAD